MTDSRKIIFPILENAKDNQEYEVINIFLIRFRDLNDCRDDVRVLKSIYKTADLTACSDGLVAKILIDHGLRAPRQSLPQEFLDHIDGLALRKTSLMSMKLKESYRDLKDFWINQGGNPFSFLHSIPAQSRIPSFQGA